MTVIEKIKALATADATLAAIINTRFFFGQAPPGPAVTLPYVAAMADEVPLYTHNSPLQSVRRWKVTCYAYGATYLSGHILARQLEASFTSFSDVAIKDISLDEGINYLGFQPEAKVFAFSTCFEVWEQLT